MQILNLPIIGFIPFSIMNFCKGQVAIQNYWILKILNKKYCRISTELTIYCYISTKLWILNLKLFLRNENSQFNSVWKLTKFNKSSWIYQLWLQNIKFPTESHKNHKISQIQNSNQFAQNNCQVKAQFMPSNFNNIPWYPCFNVYM